MSILPFPVLTLENSETFYILFFSFPLSEFTLKYHLNEFGLV